MALSFPKTLLTPLIRLATPADVSSIIRLERTCASAAHWTERQYRQAFEDGGVKRLVLVADTAAHSVPAIPGADPNILAFLVAVHLAPEWELENIVVSETFRRHGAALMLLAVLIAEARAHGGSEIFLEVLALT